jgi:hypothetical protein
MTEYLDDFVENNQTVSEDAAKEDTNVVISDASEMTVGDIITLKNYTYRIVAINGNTITIHIPLLEDLAVDDIGNMAIYYIELNIADVGDYLIKATDLKYGLEIVDSLKVTPKSIDTLAKEIKNLEYAILGQ